jgi:nucleoside-diphosphate-sugar epimerase
MTGASGYIGAVVAEKAVARGHQVVGLARSPASISKLEKLGVKPFPGTLESLDALTRGAAEADGVLHLGFVHEFHRPYSELIAIDKAAVRAMAKGLGKSGKPLVTTSGTAVARPAPDGGETDETSPLTENPFIRQRAGAEADALTLAADGVRASSVRLPGFVYGRGGSYFVPVLMQAAAKNRAAIHIGDGSNRTSAVDVDAAAELYLLALEKAPAGSIFNGTSESDVAFRDLAAAIGTAVGVPVKSVSKAEAETLCGPLIALYLEMNHRASSIKARELLSWRPEAKRTLVDDIARGSYRALAESLRKGLAST